MRESLDTEMTAWKQSREIEINMQFHSKFYLTRIYMDGQWTRLFLRFVDLKETVYLKFIYD